MRTRLLRSVARGKPGANSGIGPSVRSGQNLKKSGAVLTYNSKLPWIITNVHAVFSAVGKKPPRVLHGSAEMGVGSTSDPTVGKVEKWGLDDPNFFSQLDEVVPNLEPYGVGEGPAAMPNIMDVSSTYGLVGGEGFPGGRVFFRGTDERRGRYLWQDTPIIDMTPEIPKIPELTEAHLLALDRQELYRTLHDAWDGRNHGRVIAGRRDGLRSRPRCERHSLFQWRDDLPLGSEPGRSNRIDQGG